MCFTTRLPITPENGPLDSLAVTLASTPANAQDSARIGVIKETVETEPTYVQDVEIMQGSHHTNDELTPTHLSCDIEICYRTSLIDQDKLTCPFPSNHRE
jgi:hypothetical protein